MSKKFFVLLFVVFFVNILSPVSAQEPYLYGGCYEAAESSIGLRAFSEGNILSLSWADGGNPYDGSRTVEFTGASYVCASWSHDSHFLATISIYPDQNLLRVFEFASFDLENGIINPEWVQTLSISVDAIAWHPIENVLLFGQNDGIYRINMDSSDPQAQPYIIREWNWLEVSSPLFNSNGEVVFYVSTDSDTAESAIYAQHELGLFWFLPIDTQARLVSFENGVLTYHYGSGGHTFECVVRFSPQGGFDSQSLDCTQTTYGG